jgi:hypothetical protein
MEKMWSEAAVARIEVLIQPLSLKTEENHKKYVPRTAGLQVKTFTTALSNTKQE